MNQNTENGDKLSSFLPSNVLSEIESDDEKEKDNYNSDDDSEANYSDDGEIVDVINFKYLMT